MFVELPQNYINISGMNFGEMSCISVNTFSPQTKKKETLNSIMQIYLIS